MLQNQGRRPVRNNRSPCPSAWPTRAFIRYSVVRTQTSVPMAMQCARSYESLLYHSWSRPRSCRNNHTDWTEIVSEPLMKDTVEKAQFAKILRCSQRGEDASAR